MGKLAAGKGTWASGDAATCGAVCGGRSPSAHGAPILVQSRFSSSLDKLPAHCASTALDARVSARHRPLEARLTSLEAISWLDSGDTSHPLVANRALSIDFRHAKPILSRALLERTSLTCGFANAHFSDPPRPRRNLLTALDLRQKSRGRSPKPRSKRNKQAHQAKRGAESDKKRDAGLPTQPHRKKRKTSIQALGAPAPLRGLPSKHPERSSRAKKRLTTFAIRRFVSLWARLSEADPQVGATRQQAFAKP